jgi:hypothetical protein
MPDVTVTYIPDAPPAQQFTFSPPVVTMTASGSIVLRRANGATWTFAGFDWCGTPPPVGAFNRTMADDAITLDDTFDHGAADNGHFHYKVAVTPAPGTGPIWSPDPEVFNDYPTPAMRYVRRPAPAGGLKG